MSDIRRNQLVKNVKTFAIKITKDSEVNTGNIFWDLQVF